ncbi:MAG: 50S ribosomal protein L19, partial [Ruminococcaceae bacterium]|nr:50S ribosomal protein L19 [Oscillospiraceae bacterium]
RADKPEVAIGDTVKVYCKIKEGDHYRTQIFEGAVIAKQHGGISESFTVRRVAHGCGIERVFPIHSPMIEKVELVRHGRVRRAKLYYLRDRVGKAAKVKQVR